jgi:hypothetical protein
MTDNKPSTLSSRTLFYKRARPAAKEPQNRISEAALVVGVARVELAEVLLLVGRGPGLG